ncbi:MAG: DUF47 domain-containing protein [Ferrimicrobium sp.]
MRAIWPTSITRWGARLAHDLTGHASLRLVALLEEQLVFTTRGAYLVKSLTASEITISAAHDSMRLLEHDGDRARGRLITELGRVLTTPVDVEDLFRVSRSIDDVLDNLRDFVREVDLYQPAELGFAHPLANTLVEGLESFFPALIQLVGDQDSVRQASLATRKAAGQIRWLYQHELAVLFAEPVDSEAMKRRELLRRLDIVGLRLGEAADALADGALKRGR